ncbi:hypothetical protein [Brachybacterium aquaticum]|uniref:Uncharacterized protein n=1 Tax=Brachybacterium aquaticum TaxID=1432564 RepID=A0A841AHV1_9MICO|nr:hypothetical protein [Brachybacterium aquaticum]MBB5833161.1 hypothetical protein [Brachybacterium aquaticum]
MDRAVGPRGGSSRGTLQGARTRRVALCGAAALLLAGCTGGAEPLPAADAVEHYDQAAQALLAELSSQQWTLDEGRRSVAEEDGQCLYSPGTWEAEGTLDGVSGEDGWDELAQRLDPVLAVHGFEDLGDPRRQGALYSVTSTDAHGAELVLDEQGRLSMRGAHVETSSCTPEVLGL